MARDLRTLLKHFFLLFLALLAMFPFLWMLGASLKTNPEIASAALLPKHPQPVNFAIVLRLATDARLGRLLDLNFPKWYFNSFFVAAWVTSLQVLTSALAAFAFSRLRWRGRETVFLIYLGTMMIPSLMLILPNYQMMVKLGLVNTYGGLILPMAFSAFGTFLLRQFMIAIPRSYDEAAEIDGAGPLQIFLDVILPLARPGLVTLTILTFLGNFQSFFWPLVMVKDEYLRTIPIGLLTFQVSYSQQTELMMAATVMNIVPLIIFFIVMQKQLVTGIQLGGVKG
jgi:multiple sugar transport system permease protein